MSRKILLIEDDAAAADYVRKGLSEAGFLVETSANGRDGLFLASEGIFDAMVVDRMVPGLDGLSVIAAARAAGIATPALILSALGTVDDRVQGLRAGADDYLTKPFSFAELLARVEALLRRATPILAPGDDRLTIGDLELDLRARKASRGGRAIALGAKEFALLTYLARNVGQVVTRTMMLEKIWDYHFDPGSNVVDVHIGRLRRKIDEGFDTALLHTVRGAGYMLSADG
ncbi:response regulator transcription factor [Stakelama marina]|uniref:Response regulator transcription factor n=1 Tax=Stakelama marina TaxID=2826939 RepID=A0A8T4IGK3_9SPHN|nr:response regulator transcription factor [Stakelama marina]MBR0552195.1 response regulator transcription factor [Stakelama marina]